MALSDGPRIFYINSAADVPKLEGWLRKGPKYLQCSWHEGSPRKVYLFGKQLPSEESASCVGIIIAMSQDYSRDQVYEIAKKWRSSK